MQKMMNKCNWEKYVETDGKYQRVMKWKKKTAREPDAQPVLTNNKNSRRLVFFFFSACTFFSFHLFFKLIRNDLFMCIKCYTSYVRIYAECSSFFFVRNFDRTKFKMYQSIENRCDVDFGLFHKINKQLLKRSTSKMIRWTSKMIWSTSRPIFCIWFNKSCFFLVANAHHHQ